MESEDFVKGDELPDQMPEASKYKSKVDDFFYIIGPDHRFIYVNPPLLSLWGKEMSEVIGKNFEDLGYPPELVELHRLQLEEAFTGNIVNGENEFTDIHGITQFYEYVFVPVMDKESRVSAIAGSTKNVTVRKEIETKLLESENAFRTFAEAMPQMAFIGDSEGNIIYYNQSWYDFIQISGTEGTGWKDLPVHHPDDLAPTIEKWKTAVATGLPYEAEYRLRRHDGEYIWHLGRALPLRNSEGRITKWIGTNTDIHQQKLLQERNQLLMMKREKLVLGFSHDLRSPLTVTKLKANLIQRLSTQPQIVTLSQEIARNIDRANRMISDLLDASRIEAGEPMNLKMSDFALDTLTSGIIDEFRSVYGNRFILQCQKMPFGHWDPDAMKRILENLISNAVKYGHDKDAIVISLVNSGPGRISLSIHNKGTPISPDDQKTLFQLYRRSQITSGREGWGIGLTLVKGLAEAHGGSVCVESSASGGTTFTVSLPLDSRNDP